MTNLTVAKEIPNSGGGVLIHFYGHNAFLLAKAFPKSVVDTHPFQALCEMGFEPMGDKTWTKRTPTQDDQ